MEIIISLSVFYVIVQLKRPDILPKTSFISIKFVTLVHNMYNLLKL